MALLVLSDYLTLLVWWAKIFICAYILLQAAALAGGLIIGMLKLTEKDNKWLEILNYRIVRFFPTISLGSEVFAWAMSNASEESESESQEQEAEETQESPVNLTPENPVNLTPVNPVNLCPN